MLSSKSDLTNKQKCVNILTHQRRSILIFLWIKGENNSMQKVNINDLYVGDIQTFYYDEGLSRILL